MLEIQNVYKNYGKQEVLKGISFKVEDNEIKGLIGVNGAGKSTLIEIICGIKKMNSGSIFIDNVNIETNKNRESINRLIGYMPQTFALFNDLTVEENIGYLSAVYDITDKNRINELINQCHLSNYKKVLAKNLSGGYRQLLSMAACLIHKPKILILDEPSSAMDPLFRKKFWGIINECKKDGATVLLITHYMEELYECNSFVCISNGKVAFDGKIDEFKKDNLLDIEKILEKFSQGENNGKKD